MKIPKQWLHWAKKAGIKPERRRGDFNQMYLVGLDRRWRVNSYGEFQCSCPLEYFDKWSNSVGASMPGIPESERAFFDTIELLLRLSEDAR